VFREWTVADLRQKLESLVRDKDSKTYHGGPYSKIVVVIHCDEPAVDEAMCAAALANFRVGGLKQVDEAYLMLSYRPNSVTTEGPNSVEANAYPILRIDVGRSP